MQDNERKDLVVKNEKFNISNFINQFTQKRNYSKFKKCLIEDAVKYLTGDPRLVKHWNKMSDEDKINFIMKYTTGRNKFINSEHRKYNTVVNREDRIYIESFFYPLIYELLKNCNYNVQSNICINYQEIVNDIKININAYIIDLNWENINPKLQQEILKRVMNIPLDKMNIDSKDIDGATFAWIYGTSYMSDWQKDECKSEYIIQKIGNMDKKALIEIYDEVQEFIKNHAKEEQIREFIGELPDEIRKEKIYGSVEYCLRDEKLFKEKWNSLSYDEKLSEFKNIFYKYTKEYKNRQDALNDKNKSVIDIVYPKIYSIEEEKIPFSKKAYFNFQPNIINFILNDIRSEDLDKYICGIVESKKNDPITLHCIWSSLNKKLQDRYYNSVIEILKDEPESKFEIWNTSKFDSNNKKKKAQNILTKIRLEDDLKKVEKQMRLLIKGEERKGKGKRKEKKEIDLDI